MSIKKLRKQARALAIEADELRRKADALLLAGQRGYKALYKEAKAKDAEVDAVCKEIAGRL